jgi:hypothetical protein
VHVRYLARASPRCHMSLDYGREPGGTRPGRGLAGGPPRMLVGRMGAGLADGPLRTLGGRTGAGQGLPVGARRGAASGVGRCAREVTFGLPACLPGRGSWLSQCRAIRPASRDLPRHCGSGGKGPGAAEPPPPRRPSCRSPRRAVPPWLPDCPSAPSPPRRAEAAAPRLGGTLSPAWTTGLGPSPRAPMGRPTASTRRRAR